MKRGEEFRLVVGRDADAGVGHLEEQRDRLAVRRRLGRAVGVAGDEVPDVVRVFHVGQRARHVLARRDGANLQLDGTLRREFDRVGYEVGDNLADSHVVAEQPLGYVRRDAVVEHELLVVRLDALHLQRQVDARLDREGLDVERQLLGFNLGKVQHVGDERE